VDIETIREKIGRGRYIISFTHTEKLRQRRIKAQDIEEAVKIGTIIEEYPDDPRGASCLILGVAGERPLHVLCGRLDAEEILIITAYEPDPVEWEDDWKTRKAR
jgi:hypothetical protein